MGGIVWLLCCDFAVFLTTSLASAYDNIAFGKSAWQQHPYGEILLFSFSRQDVPDWKSATWRRSRFPVRYYYSTEHWKAYKAVDGAFTDLSANGYQCTVSENAKQTATLWVDLGRILSIRYITIYYRTENEEWDFSNQYTKRFLGFSVHISNSTNREDGILCFKDTNYTRATIPNPAKIECLKYGRYVIYYNERIQGVTYPDGYSKYAFNELCELQVYGCPTSGVFGENCNVPCPQNCQEGHCNIVDGTCLGCVAGYKGSRCEEECDNNRYGFECKLICGNCSDGEQCDHVNGSCPNGCDFGSQGDICDKECPVGRFGFNCQDICSINCGVPGTCNRVTGQCEGGCQKGWKDMQCDKKCDRGMFGLNCNQSCGVCLGNEQCHHINETCMDGCDKGYQGMNCAQACPNGLHGYNCDETCSADCLVQKSCDAITGQCSACPNGLHGYNCDETCSADCLVQKSCDAITGQCSVISSDSETNSQCYPSLYGVVSTLCLSLALNIFLLIWISRNRVCKGMCQEEKSTKQLSTEHSKPNTEIYDKVEDNAGYQELGQISQPSHYDKLH
ncbi:multiple epidermal growth factor-like domains protein 10 [Saccostrea echinata]|uniref:multiple epidermal growth factor-like domains protein 10 n=1 Tax=Saccostrea echinata TaxID=191078 RepID=UPI002A82245D|nr:multiple epidermal growth factor-like domains protein 10 [Saccostrea echinata]